MKKLILGIAILSSIVGTALADIVVEDTDNGTIQLESILPSQEIYKPVFFTNNGTENATIVSWFISGDVNCFSLEKTYPAEEETLPANGTAVAIVKFSCEEAGSYNGTLCLVTDKEKGCVTLKGNVEFEVDKSLQFLDENDTEIYSIFLPEVNYNEKVTLTLKLKNPSQYPIYISKCYGIGAPVSFSEPCPFKLNGNETKPINVEITPIGVGINKVELVFEWGENGTQQERLPVIMIAKGEGIEIPNPTDVGAGGNLGGGCSLNGGGNSAMGILQFCFLLAGLVGLKLSSRGSRN